MVQVLCSAGVNLDEDLDETNLSRQPAASGLSKLLESDGEKDDHHPQNQHVPCFTDPIDCRQKPDTVAGLPDATTEIFPSKAEQTCTVPEDLMRPTESTTAFSGDEDQDNCTVIHQVKLLCDRNLKLLKFEEISTKRSIYYFKINL